MNRNGWFEWLDLPLFRLYWRVRLQPGVSIPDTVLAIMNGILPVSLRKSLPNYHLYIKPPVLKHSLEMQFTLDIVVFLIYLDQSPANIEGGGFVILIWQSFLFIAGAQCLECNIWCKQWLLRGENSLETHGMTETDPTGRSDRTSLTEPLVAGSHTAGPRVCVHAPLK